MYMPHIRRVALLVTIILFLPFNSSFAGNHCATLAGKLVSIQGQVTVNSQAAENPVQFCPGSIIATGPNSRAAVFIYDQNTLLRLNQNTEYTIGEDENNHSLIEVFKGVIHIFSRVPQSLKIKTPFVNATIEGTEFVVDVDDKKSDIIVFEGQVRVSNTLGELILSAGEAATAANNQAPIRRTVINPLNEVNWALYYPPIKSDDSGYSSNIEQASTYLNAGQSKQAQSILENLVADQPDNAVALSLLSMIAVTQNDTAKALLLAKQAVVARPISISYIASSYANQANLNLELALEDATKAYNENPDDNYALLRLAEMQSATGESAKAYANTKNAVERSPSISRAHTQLGFNLLEQFELTQAISTFEKAIELDQTDPLPRLGLGLANIRNSQLNQGIEQFEIAVVLSPNNSLIRSFLGNAYIDGNDYENAAEQFSLSKQLDVKDPTPYLYNALSLQKQNRPVEALKEINQSIERNDKRAVLRSKNLLDQDFSARVTRQGRIYRDLGFEQLALIEGWKAVQSDPANHAGHRFLADVYSGLPRHELARDSELLQAELLQPAIVNAVDPRLNSNGLSFLNDTSFVEFGANDHTRSFQSNGFNLKLDGLAGSNSTYADNATVTGNQDRLSFSLGQFHYETEGIRENNDEQRTIYAGLAQYNLTPKTSLFFEARQEKIDRGDISLLFDQEIFGPQRRQDSTRNDYRLSFRHEFTTDSVLTGYYFSRRDDFDFQFSSNRGVDTSGDIDSFELRQFQKLDFGNITFGARQVDDKYKETTFDPDGLFFEGDLENKNQQRKFYFYSDYFINNNTTSTIGFSVDRYKNKNIDRKIEKFNPKIGGIWNVTDNTKLRIAAFKTTFISTTESERTLEPTNIAGFNQFFDEFLLTDSYHYGLGVDNRVDDDTFLGSEFKYVSSKVPIAFDFGEDIEFNQRELNVRSYLFRTLLDRWSFKTELFYRKFNRDDDFISLENFIPTNTYLLSFGVRYFNHEGWLYGVNVNMAKQKVKFETDLGSLDFDKDKFVTFDNFIGYRFKNNLNGLIFLEIKNIFDKNFNFQSLNPSNSSFTKSREFFLKIKLEF